MSLAMALMPEISRDRAINFIIPFMYLDMIMGGILNGLNEQVK